jgi:acetoin utilization protein AcuC
MLEGIERTMGDHCPLAVVWDERFLEYDFGEGHPFNEKSRALGERLLRSMGHLPTRPTGNMWQISEVEPATREELELFHLPHFLDRVMEEGHKPSPGILDQGDTPAFENVYEASSRIVGGSLACLKTVLEDPRKHATNFSGGLHHSAPGRASGFCVLNDAAVTIAKSLKTFSRVMYIDIDAHHGDGVMYGFYSNGKVLDIDFHQDGKTLFPGSGATYETGEGDGKGIKVNVPLPPGAGDEAFIPLFKRIVPDLARDFKPELILMQSGVDGHVGDPLAHLQFTPAAYTTAINMLHELAHEVSGGRFIFVGGGGYLASNISRVLAREALLVSGEEVPEGSAEMPQKWRDVFYELVGEDAPKTWGQLPPLYSSNWREEKEEKLIDELQRRLGRKFPKPSAE